MCPYILENTKNVLHIPHTNLKRFGDRAFCAYAQCLRNEFPEDTCSVQNFKKQLKTLLFWKEFYLTMWTINNCPLTFFKALLNTIGVKGAISNINYYIIIIRSETALISIVLSMNSLRLLDQRAALLTSSYGGSSTYDISDISWHFLHLQLVGDCYTQ